MAECTAEGGQASFVVRAGKKSASHRLGRSTPGWFFRERNAHATICFPRVVRDRNRRNLFRGGIGAGGDADLAEEYRGWRIEDSRALLALRYPLFFFYPLSSILYPLL